MSLNISRMCQQNSHSIQKCMLVATGSRDITKEMCLGDAERYIWEVCHEDNNNIEENNGIFVSLFHYVGAKLDQIGLIDLLENSDENLHLNIERRTSSNWHEEETDCGQAPEAQSQSPCLRLALIQMCDGLWCFTAGNALYNIW